ncbi:hypothetical protein [Paenibacillus campi]|uniref:hypothetical protein n=1 Tax=Paenibacillus campi TaxID=3106031 RepID=UPI002AFFB2A1|nr:hypothetical protein [Paenibacillus sp. SGZ-1014]
MALPVAALQAFCIVIFETGPRALNSYPESARPEIMEYAAQVKQYNLVVYDTTLAAGRVTQAQYDTIVSMMPPVAAPAAEQQTESTE